MEWTVAVGNPPAILSAQVQRLGDDILVVITGLGPHLGAVSIGIPYMSQNSIETASSSVITVPGHKDGVLCEKIATGLAKALRKRVAVVGGVHIPQATEDDIKAVMASADQLIQEITEELC